MKFVADHRKTRGRAALAIVAFTLSGCGDDSTRTATGDQQGTTIITSAPPPTAPVATTAATRSLVPTTALPSVADASVDKSLIPEATAYYEVEPTTINGVQFANSLRIDSGRTPKKVEINAGRSRQKFLGTLGIPDDQKSSTSVQVEISLDNAPPVFSTVVNFGERRRSTWTCRTPFG